MAYRLFLMHHPRWNRDDAEQFLRHVQSTTSSSPKCICSDNSFVEFRTCDIFDLGYVYTYNYLRASSKLTVRVKLFLSFISRMAKRFELANIERNKMKRISIMSVWLLMFIDNEYNYCAWTSIRTIEGSDNRGSDNRGSTVHTHESTSSHETNTHICMV